MNKNKNHICSNIKYCTCYSLALEPNEDCVIHGFGFYKQPRCIYCGRFMKKNPEIKLIRVALKHELWYAFEIQQNNSEWIKICLKPASSSKDRATRS